MESVALEIRPAGGAIESEADRTREAEDILAALGVELFSGSEGDGLVVKRVAPDGLADRQGIDPGDRLLAVNGLTLAGPTDLAGLDPEETSSFEFLTESGAIREFSGQLVKAAPLKSDEFAAVLLTALLLGGLPRLQRASSSAPSPGSPGYGRNPLASIVGTALLSTPLLLFPALVMLSRAEAAGTIFLICVAGVGVALSTLYGGGEGGAAHPGVPAAAPGGRVRAAPGGGVR